MKEKKDSEYDFDKGEWCCIHHQEIPKESVLPCFTMIKLCSVGC